MAAIAIYGANGRLGRQVASALVGRGADVRLGARDAGRLAAAAGQIGGAPRQQVAALEDSGSLRLLLTGCRVVVNAGPTAEDPGCRLLRAALDASVHYIDVSGSQAYIRRLFESFGETAERRGVAVVPAFGFDYALGDCLARLTARHVEPAREIAVAYAIDGSDVAANSLQFAAETAGGGEVFYDAGRWRPARQDIFRRMVEFPPPFGRQAVARYGAGEIVTVPRHTVTDAVLATITTKSLVPHPALIPWFPYLRPAVALVRRTPARRLLGLAARLRGAPPAPATDAPVTRPSTSPRFAIVVDAQGREPGTRWRGTVEGGDFHAVTVAALAFGAESLAASGFSASGVLPPARAVDPAALFDALSPLGLRVRVERTDTRRPAP
jgi:short subunit dehydrogenase-like uncharacterized protein